MVNMKKYFHIVKFRTPQNILVNLNSMLPLIVMPIIFDAHYVGIFALARTVLMLPGNLIASSVGDVIYPKLNNAINNKNTISRDLIKITMVLILIGIIPLCILFFWGAKLFLFVFGDQWGVAGELSGILVFWIFFNLINKPLIVLIPMFGLERKFLFNSVINSLLGIVCFLITKEYDVTFMKSMVIYTLFLIIPQIFIMITVCIKIKSYEDEIKV